MSRDKKVLVNPILTVGQVATVCGNYGCNIFDKFALILIGYTKLLFLRPIPRLLDIPARRLSPLSSRLTASQVSQHSRVDIAVGLVTLVVS